MWFVCLSIEVLPLILFLFARYFFSMERKADIFESKFLSWILMVRESLIMPNDWGMDIFFWLI